MLNDLHDDGQVQPDASRLPAPPPPSTTSRSDTADAGTDGHRTLTPDTGHRTRAEDVEPVTKARPASAPPGLLRPAAARWDAQPCSCGQRRGDCNHDGSAAGPPASARRPLRTARKLLGRPADQAPPRRIAVLRRLRVERRANGEASSVMAATADWVRSCTSKVSSRGAQRSLRY
jgi:hypothetical protein